MKRFGLRLERVYLTPHPSRLTSHYSSDKQVRNLLHDGARVRLESRRSDRYIPDRKDAGAAAGGREPKDGIAWQNRRRCTRSFASWETTCGGAGSPKSRRSSATSIPRCGPTSVITRCCCSRIILPRR